MSGILDYIIENVAHLHEEYTKFKDQNKLRTRAIASVERPSCDRTVVASGSFELNFA